MARTNKEPFVGLAAGFSPAGVSCEATRGKAPITWYEFLTYYFYLKIIVFYLEKWKEI